MINPIATSSPTSSSTLSPSTTATGGSSASTSSALTSAGMQGLNESAFLQLLSTELQYQNPTQPVNDTQFVAELAQFSTLAAVTQQTSTLSSILTELQSGDTGLGSAVQLIGHSVTWAQGQGAVTAVTVNASGDVTLDVGNSQVALSAVQSVS